MKNHALESVRYLLLQIRDPDDPMLGQEVACFARALGCPSRQICTMDLIRRVPTPTELSAVDIVLLGGSGDYSVAEGGPWLPAALEAMRELYDLSKPTFASCWGFQAMARALGGAVVTDLNRAELGTVQARLTAAGQRDPIFSPMGELFRAQMGHQDIVDRLPEGAVLLASTDRVENQAFCFPDKRIYCTQFHPELDRVALLERVRAYPQYVKRIAGMTLEQFAATSQDTPESESLLTRFAQHVMNQPF